MKKHLVLAHGLYQGPWFMRHLNGFFQTHGYEVHLLRYDTLKNDMAAHLLAFQNLMQPIPKTAHVDFIGHSMGGLVIREYAHHHPERFTGSVVTLGTPHQGSSCAAWANQHIPRVLGKSFQAALNGHVAQWQNICPLGSIAGNKKYELGTLVLPRNVVHDGLVLETETQLDNATDHITLSVHHNGMRHDTNTMIQSLYFLQNTRFVHHYP